MTVETRSTTGTPGPWFRTLCGAITLGLSLVCMISSLPYLTTTSGSEQLTIWGFFLWGLGLVVAGVLAWPAGVVLGELVHPWFEEILPRLAAGLLVAAAVLGYRIKKSRPPGTGPDASPGR